MKSELNVATTKEVVKFPRMYRNKIFNFVVLFISESCGVVVSDGNKENPIGYYSDDWVVCTYKSDWIELPNGSTLLLTQGD